MATCILFKKKNECYMLLIFEMSISPGCLSLQIPECRDLGHTSVMLPNAFGHNSLEQATTYFKVFKNESCSASALYYICNMLFPKCDPATKQVIYPCQSHCRGTQLKKILNSKPSNMWYRWATSDHRDQTLNQKNSKYNLFACYDLSS